MCADWRVGVGAGLQKRVEDIHVAGGLVVVRARMGVVGELERPLGLEHREEGSDAVGVGGQIGVGAALDEQHRHVELAVERGDGERAGPVARDLVDVGAAVQQHPGHLEVALAGGVQQGGHAAGPADQGFVHGPPKDLLVGDVARGGVPRGHHVGKVVGVEVRHLFLQLPGSQELPLDRERGLHFGGGRFTGGSALGGPLDLGQSLQQTPLGGPADRHAAQHVPHLGGDRGIGAVTQQFGRGGRAPGGSGEHEGRLPGRSLARVHRRAVLQQQTHGPLAVARLRRQVEGGHAAGGGYRPRVTARVQQRAHHVRMSRASGQVQGRVVTDARGRLRLGSRANQDVHDLQVTLAGGHVQRRQAVSLREVGIRALLQ